MLLTAAQPSIGGEDHLSFLRSLAELTAGEMEILFVLQV